MQGNERTRAVAWLVSVPANTLCRILTRAGRAREGMLYLGLALLFARALLPGAVMFDADESTGDFGLVICSGHGPMFVRGVMPAAEMSVMTGIGASSWLAVPMDSRSSTGHRPSAGDDNGVCPFGAALSIACVGAILILLLVAETLAKCVWPASTARGRARKAPRTRPPSRAPPYFA
jgi:hypothetical protein